MLRIYAVHPAEAFIPAFSPFSRIVQKRRIRGISRHHEPVRAPGDQILLDIKPLVRFCKDLRLVLLDPLVFPHRIFYARRRRVRDLQTLQQLEDVDTCDPDAVALTFLHFPYGSLIHVAHRPSQRPAFPVDQHHSLHLRAERYPVYHIRGHIGLRHYLFRGAAHGLPPLVRILFGTAVFQYVKIIVAVCACYHLYRFTYGKQAGLEPCRAYIICDNIKHFLLLLRYLQMSAVIAAACDYPSAGCACCTGYPGCACSAPSMNWIRLSAISSSSSDELPQNIFMRSL